jgi:hypothetical protein
MEKLKERDCFENTVMNERIILKGILKKYGQGRGMFTRGRTRTRIFCCENVLEFLSSIKCVKFV